MTKDEATKLARDKDITAKAGLWYKAVERRGEWFVARIDGDKGTQRIISVR